MASPESPESYDESYGLTWQSWKRWWKLRPHLVVLKAMMKAMASPGSPESYDEKLRPHLAVLKALVKA
jgi:hypothetical protein